MHKKLALTNLDPHGVAAKIGTIFSDIAQKECNDSDMKKSEVIEYLNSIEGDYDVFVQGYEQGLESLELINVEDVALNVDDRGVYGEHDRAIYQKRSAEKYETVKGIIFFRLCGNTADYVKNNKTGGW